VFDIHIDWNL